MKPTLRKFGASPRTCLPEWRLACEAIGGRVRVGAEYARAWLDMSQRMFVRGARVRGSLGGRLPRTTRQARCALPKCRGQVVESRVEASYHERIKRDSDDSCDNRYRRARSVGVRPDSRRVHRARGVEVAAKPRNARTELEVGEYEQVHAHVDRRAPSQAKHAGCQGVERVHAGGAERSE
eukprot:5594847-Pleurochrysis_carterae.AAC.2